MKELIDLKLRRNGQVQSGNKPTKIVLHHADWTCASPEEINEMHIKDKGFSMGGYHAYVRKDGSCYKMRETWEIGAHCIGQNSISLGICAEGNYLIEHMPTEQKESIIELCKQWCSEFNIPLTEVYGHCEVGQSDCPERNYPLQEVKYRVEGEEEEMLKYVTYLGDADVFGAIIVSQKLGCALMKKSDFDNQGIKGEEIKVGGKEGSTRFTTFKDCASML